MLSAITDFLRRLVLFLVVLLLLAGLGYAGWRHYDTRRGWPGGFDPATLPKPSEHLRFGLIDRPIELPLRAASKLPSASKAKVEFIHCNDARHRFQQLAAGTLDATFASLDEISQIRGEIDPGQVALPVAENTGAEAVVLHKPGFTNSTYIGFLPGGTSEALVRALPNSTLKPVAVADPQTALRWLSEGKLQGACLWNPYLERAVSSGGERGYDTNQRPTQEVLLISYQAAQDPAKQEQLLNLLKCWFSIVEQYRSQPDLPLKAMASDSELKPEDVKQALEKLKLLTTGELQNRFDQFPAQIQHAVEQDMNFWALAGLKQKDVDLNKLVNTALLEKLLEKATVSNPAPSSESTPTPANPEAVPTRRPHREPNFSATGAPVSESPQPALNMAASVTQGGGPERSGSCPGPALREFSSVAFQANVGGELQGVPVGADDQIIVGCEDHHVRCLDQRNGNPKWDFPCDDAFRSSASVTEDSVFIGGVDGSLYCLNRKNGEKRWAVPSQGEILGAPALADSKIVFANRAGQVICLDGEGKEQWKMTCPGNVTAAPSIQDRIVVVGCYDGLLYAFNLADGKKRWTARTKSVIQAPACISNGRVFVGSQDRNFYCFDLDDGKEKWRKATQGQLVYAAAVCGDVVCVGSSDTKIYGFSVDDGTKVWEYPTRERISSAVVACEDLVYAGSEDKHLYALSAKSGQLVMKFEAGGWVGTPWIQGKQAFFPCSDGKLYCIK